MTYNSLEMLSDLINLASRIPWENMFRRRERSLREYVLAQTPNNPPYHAKTSAPAATSREEISYFTLYNLQKALQGLEVHLPLRGVGRERCDCLDKHSADVDLYGSEAINYGDDPQFYQRLSGWGRKLNRLLPDRGLELGTMKKEDYDRFAKEAREFRKRVQEDKERIEANLLAKMSPAELEEWKAQLEEATSELAEEWKPLVGLSEKVAKGELTLEEAEEEARRLASKEE
jgi:hypothetical protein